MPPRLMLALRLMRAAVMARYPAAAASTDDLLGEWDGAGCRCREGVEADWSEFVRSM